MVHTGQLETLKPSVKDIWMVEMAKRVPGSDEVFLEYVESVDLEVC